MLPRLFAVIAAAFPLVAAASSTCKCTPRDSCWPSEHDWQRFNATINGRLIKAHPAASVCYKSQPGYDEAACSAIRDQWTNSTFHGQDPISIDYPFLANNTCPPIFPNGTSVSGDPNAGSRGCSLGGYPSYVVDAADATVIAAALKWAQKKRIRVVVKNSGHSHLGRSTGYGSLSIWMRNIKKVEYIEKFQSASCKSNSTRKAARIGAGEVGIDVNRALDRHGAVVVAGANPSVGIVGWFTGGGHGPLSSDYGMGSDNLLEATLVTSNGTILTVNACQHPDLFYALRGGGGGTYGVVTSVVMQAYASPRTTLWSFSINLVDQTNESQWWDLVAFFHAQLPAWKEAGMQGYYYILGPPSMKSRMLAGGFYMYNKPNGTVESLVAPLKTKIDSMPKVFAYQSSVQTASSFMEIYGNTQNEQVGSGGFSLGSRLLPAEPLQDTKAMTTLFQELSGVSNDNTTSIPVAVIIGHVIANSNNAGLETGLNSAWRKAVVHFLVVGGWPDGAPESVAKAVRDDVTNRKTYAMRKLAPDSGAYFNEMDINEPNWQYAAFGSNYPRLRAVKEKPLPRRRNLETEDSPQAKLRPPPATSVLESTPSAPFRSSTSTESKTLKMPAPGADAPLQERLLALAQTLQFAWFAGHLTLIITTIRYSFSWVRMNYYGGMAVFCYRTSFVAAALTYGIVVYKTQKARAKTGTQMSGGIVGLLGDENIQYLLMALVWLIAPQYPLALIPYCVYSTFNAATYVRANLLPVISPAPPAAEGAASPRKTSSPLADRIGAFVKEYYDSSMSVVSGLEILLWFRIVLSAILFQRRSWILLGLYTVFLRARYSQNSHVQTSFGQLAVRIDSLVSAQGTPPIARQIWDSVKNYTRQFRDATELSRYTGGAGPAKKTS